MSKLAAAALAAVTLAGGALAPMTAAEAQPWGHHHGYGWRHHGYGYGWRHHGYGRGPYWGRREYGGGWGWRHRHWRRHGFCRYHSC